MAKLVWILVLVAVASVLLTDISASSTGGSNVVTELKGRDNPKTPDCPHGRRYLSKCNWCSCTPGQNTICTLQACQDWTCEKSMALHTISDTECVGHCNCNSDTLITTCEKRGCN